MLSRKSIFKVGIYEGFCTRVAYSAASASVLQTC